MGNPTYYLNFNSTGEITGSGFTPDGTLPPDVITCSRGLAENFEGYSVDVASSPPTIVQPSKAKLLAAAQSAQSAIIKQACADAIKSAFQFTANGNTYTATLSANDQANLARNSAVALGIPAKAQAWSSGMTVAARGICFDVGEYYISFSGGTAGTTKPTWPTSFGTPVTDGTVQWELFGVLVGTTTGTIRVTYADFMTLFEQFSEFMDTTLGKCTALLNEIASATTQTAVKAITW